MTFNSLLRDQFFSRFTLSTPSHLFQFSLARSDADDLQAFGYEDCFFQFSLARSGAYLPQSIAITSTSFQFSLARSDTNTIKVGGGGLNSLSILSCEISISPSGVTSTFGSILSILSCEISNDIILDVIATVKQSFQFSLARSESQRRRCLRIEAISFNSLLRDQLLWRVVISLCWFRLSILSCEISTSMALRSYATSC